MNQDTISPAAQIAAELSGDPSMADEVTRHERAIRFVSALVDCRISKSLTQKDVASRMGVSASTVSRLEDSLDADVRFGDFISYANSVGVNVSVLMEDSSIPLAARIKNCVLQISCCLDHLTKLAANSHGDQSIIDGINRFRGEVLYNFLLRYVKSGFEMPRISFPPDVDESSVQGSSSFSDSVHDSVSKMTLV